MPGLKQQRRDSRRTAHQPVEVSVPLRDVRAALKLSLSELAALMPPRVDGTRWSVATISRAETGQRGASDELMSALLVGLREACNCRHRTRSTARMSARSSARIGARR